MSSVTLASEPTVPSLAQQNATRVLFFIAGFSMGSWAPLVPYAKNRALLDERSLGLLLLCLGIGSIVTMPFTGMLAGRFGCRIVLIVAALASALTLPFLATVSSAAALAPVLFCFGAAVGTIDVAVNIQAVEVEKACRRPMMSGFHGLFSVGGMVGALGITGLLGMKLSPANAGLFSSALILLLVAGFGRNLLPYRTESDAPLWVVPRGKVLLIGVLCFILFMAEGVVLDWSALFLTSLRSVEKAHAGLGYAAFSVTMTLGRLNGDRIVASLGRRAILVGGGLCAALGFALAVAVPSGLMSIIGFALVGIGGSNIVPVLFTQIGQQKAMPANLAISAVTTIGYLGILAGPAFVGFVAHATSLSLALLLVALSILLVPATTAIVLRD